MASVNKVVLVGNLGRDPECRSFPNGDQIANVTIATTDKWKDKATGELREVTEWHRIAFNGRLAEVVGQYLRKGSQIYVEGSLRTRKWTDKDGVEKYTTEIRANEMQMLGSKPSGGRDDEEYSAPRQAPAQRPVAQRHAPSQHSTPTRQPVMSGGGGGGGFSDFDDDIPFRQAPESRFPV